MKLFITNLFTAIFSFIDAGWCFLITLFLNICILVIKIILRCKKKGDGSFCAFNFISLSLVLFEGFSLLIMGEDLGFALFNLAFYYLTIAPFYFTKKRERIVLTSAQKNMVKELDGKIKLEEQGKEEEKEKRKKESVLYPFVNELQNVNDMVKKSNVISLMEENNIKKGTDYSSVKNAIEKTLLKEVSEEERRRLISLEISILQSEKGDENLLIKKEINEGLSALLKIMARYAV